MFFALKSRLSDNYFWWSIKHKTVKCLNFVFLSKLNVLCMMLLISVWFAWKPENLPKGEAAVGCLQLKRKQRREVERGGEGGGNGWHAVRAVSEQPTGEGVSKSVCPHYPKWLKPWLGLAEFLPYIFRYNRRVFFEPTEQVEYST